MQDNIMDAPDAAAQSIFPRVVRTGRYTVSARRNDIFSARLVGRRSAEKIEGASGLMNVVMLPMWLLSGTFFSSARFPQSFNP
jgi:hypothetical protein